MTARCSVAAPLISGVYADAPAALNDVTTGATTSRSRAYLCAAETGYDGQTGLGTPNSLAAFIG